ncbi:MAG: AbrB/MazE/SpoVT family DNA-binding domain-containing protein [Armatimonadetes bacterium]|nr:AbrB/MazE/SpoVT family DNA-binding domain-containing protein [Armatimonadota bacterium]
MEEKIRVLVKVVKRSAYDKYYSLYIVIPKMVARRLNIEEGDYILMEANPSEETLLLKKLNIRRVLMEKS